MKVKRATVVAIAFWGMIMSALTRIEHEMYGISDSVLFLQSYLLKIALVGLSYFFIKTLSERLATRFPERLGD